VDSEFPEFVAKMEERRGKIECDLLFMENGKTYQPKEGSGFGAVDVASFALRIARWSLSPNAPIFLLDEPFRDLSPDLHKKASQMVDMLSKELGLQFVLISHAEDINECANLTYIAEKVEGFTELRELK